MNNNFTDITDKLGTPEWYDIYGYPRYCRFHPSVTHDIYSIMTSLIEIRCQECFCTFEVVMSYGQINLIKLDGSHLHAKDILPTKDNMHVYWHYGDPPFHDCIGDTMNSEIVKILEFWTRNYDIEDGWVRKKEYELSGE